MSPSAAASAIDLRSDTVTRPTPGMRAAIAEAVVGDDVYDDDPTIHALQDRVAGLAGKAAGLFVPSGTMGNQIAVHVQTEPGDEVLLERGSHIFNYESGGAASLSGVQLHPLAGVRGALDPASVLAAVRDSDVHAPPARLLCLENTHNRAGGAIVPLATLVATAEAARGRGLRVHLDGARLWNAVAATGVPIPRWSAPFDTVMMCFSKGLGAPVGSILLGDAATIARARRVRKRLGGGMRQAGMLAAACLYGLDHHVERLADDHRRARRLAELIATTPGLACDPASVETNIVLIEVTDPAWDGAAVVAALAALGVRVATFGPRTVRAVTHLDIDDTAIERAGEGFARLAVDGIQAPM